MAPYGSFGKMGKFELLIIDTNEKNNADKAINF